MCDSYDLHVIEVIQINNGEREVEKKIPTRSIEVCRAPLRGLQYDIEALINLGKETYCGVEALL